MFLIFTGCATTSPQSAAPEVVVEAPTEAVDELEAFAQMVRAHVASRRHSVDECYLSEVLSGTAGGPASFEFAIRARPGTRIPVVKTVTISDPDQRILEHCVRAALVARRFPRREIRRQIVRVRIASPDWVAAR